MPCFVASAMSYLVACKGLGETKLELVEMGGCVDVVEDDGVVD